MEWAALFLCVLIGVFGILWLWANRYDAAYLDGYADGCRDVEMYGGDSGDWDSVAMQGAWDWDEIDLDDSDMDWDELGAWWPSGDPGDTRPTTGQP